MQRRKRFEPASVPAAFWQQGTVRAALARRGIDELFRLYLATFSDCTQTRLAQLTGFDPADISDLVRGTRRWPVSHIGVLDRIAAGLEMPDEARVLLGLAPVAGRLPNHGGGVVTGWYASEAGATTVRLAICGSRAAGTNGALIDDAVRSLGRLLMRRRCLVSHGPVGVGMEVMTYIADHYRPPGLLGLTGLIGRQNVVRDADYVLVVGGGSGTQDEVDMATSRGARLVPLPRSGGTATRAYARMENDRQLREWMSKEDFSALGSCDDGDAYGEIVERALSAGGMHD